MKLYLALAGIFAASLASAQVTIYVNGDTVDTGNGAPIINKGRVMIPMRAVFEKLGAKVEWYPTEAMVMVTRGTDVTRLWVGDQMAQINQEKRAMDVAPTNHGGVVRVPLRFISESLGAFVNWEPATRTVRITTATRR